MKKILAFLALSFSLFSLAACGKSVADQDIVETSDKTQQITWGVKYDTRLFGMMDVANGEVKGFDIDIARAITEKILGPQGSAVFVEVTSKTRIPLLKNGNIDAIIATMTITEERLQQVNFSDVYFDAGQSLLVHKDSGIKSIEDLDANSTVLAVKGSTSVDNIKKLAPEAKILEWENYAECFTALQSGQGDAMTTDNAILLGMASQNPDYVLAGKSFTKEPYGIAINKGQDNFLNKVNEALAEMHADGTYDKIYEKWFPESDDGRVAD